MFKATVVNLVCKVALYGHKYRKPTPIALVGLWRCALILCGLTALGFMTLSCMGFFGVQAEMPQGRVYDLLRYPLMGVGTISVGTLLILVPWFVLTDLGKWGRKEE